MSWGPGWWENQAFIGGISGLVERARDGTPATVCMRNAQQPQLVGVGILALPREQFWVRPGRWENAGGSFLPSPAFFPTSSRPTPSVAWVTELSKQEKMR